MTTEQAKQLIPDRSFIKFAGSKYRVAEIHENLIGIYDDPPSLHVDYLNINNVEVWKDFYTMQEFPKVFKDDKRFSVPVLVFEDTEPTFCEIGHYNFDTKTWTHFGDNSMKLICWCYLPDPEDFLEENREKLQWVKHDGYMD